MQATSNKLHNDPSRGHGRVAGSPAGTAAAEHRSPPITLPAGSLAALSLRLPIGGGGFPPHPALLQQVLDALGCGLLLVDALGRVLHANRAARQVCRAGAPVALQHDRLLLSDEDEAALDATLERAARGQWAMLMLRGSGGPALSVGVVPLDGGALPSTAGTDDGVAADGRPAALLVLGPQRQTSGLALQFFCQEHHLTLAERLVLQQLCDGRTPKQIAQAAGVAISTVRTQILAIRDKTRTPSIRHLLQMVEGLPPLMGAATGLPG